MSELLSDYHSPMMIISLIVGYQITIYFLYLYLKGRDEHLELNKILLAYAFLYCFLITGFVIRIINDNYSPNITRNDRLSNSLILIGSCSFLFIIGFKQFDLILDTRLTRFVMILIITILLFILFLNETITTRPSLFFGPFLIYITIFHVRLIIKSTGEIKKRLKLINIGNVVLMLSLLFSTKEVLVFFPQETHESLLILLSFGNIISLSIIILGIHNFPAFMEFGWKKNVFHFYIVNQEKKKELYSFNFHKHFKDGKEENPAVIKIFSRGILGIEEIISKITDTNDRSVKKIVHEDILITLERGDDPFSFISFSLVISREMKSLDYFLKKLKNEFQNEFMTFLLDLNSISGSEDEIFSSFDLKIKEMLK